MKTLLSILTEHTGLSEYDIRKIARNAPVRYKTYFIEKKSGGKRQISQPAKEVKALQRALLSEVILKLPVHRSATAYRPEMSIKDNALAHVDNGPILKYDFRNFFPSIVAKDWHKYCLEMGIFTDPEELFLSTQILFHKPKGSSLLRLAIGAPSSPALSNALMFRFDTYLDELLKKDKVIYTRYADDLTFSAQRTGFLNSVDQALKLTIRKIDFPKLAINDKKTVLATPKFKRLVTGLVISNDKKVSLGHERKKRIRAAVHHATLNHLSKKELIKLAGTLAFAQSVEPEFLQRLTLKYGTDVIQEIKSVK